jgi:hypothetical protein
MPVTQFMLPWQRIVGVNMVREISYATGHGGLYDFVSCIMTIFSIATIFRWGYAKINIVCKNRAKCYYLRLLFVGDTTRFLPRCIIR